MAEDQRQESAGSPPPPAERPAAKPKHAAAPPTPRRSPRPRWKAAAGRGSQAAGPRWRPAPGPPRRLAQTPPPPDLYRNPECGTERAHSGTPGRPGPAPRRFLALTGRSDSAAAPARARAPRRPNRRAARHRRTPRAGPYSPRYRWSSWRRRRPQPRPDGAPLPAHNSCPGRAHAPDRPTTRAPIGPRTGQSAAPAVLLAFPGAGRG